MSNATSAAAAPAFVLSPEDKSAAALVATIRAAVNGAGKYAAYVASHDVTRDTVKVHAFALAVLAYPNETPVQKKDGIRTKFGNAVQAAGNGLRNALDSDEDDTPKPVVLRASLSGEGGGSTVIPSDHPLYAAVVALIGANAEQ